MGVEGTKVGSWKGGELVGKLVGMKVFATVVIGEPVIAGDGIRVDNDDGGLVGIVEIAIDVLSCSCTDESAHDMRATRA